MSTSTALPDEGSVCVNGQAVNKGQKESSDVQERDRDRVGVTDMAHG